MVTALASHVGDTGALSTMNAVRALEASPQAVASEVKKMIELGDTVGDTVGETVRQ